MRSIECNSAAMDYFTKRISEEVEEKWRDKYNRLLRELNDEKASYTSLLHEKQELEKKLAEELDENAIILKANNELKQMVQEYRIKCGEINVKE